MAASMRPSPRQHTTGAFTLVEIMIALVILAVGALGILTHISTLSAMHTAAKEQAVVNQLVQAMGERLVGAPWTDLGMQPWAYSRPDITAPDTALLDYPPLFDSTNPIDTNGFRGAGLVSADTVVLSIQGSQIIKPKMYIEYYACPLAALRTLTTTPTGTFEDQIIGTGGQGQRVRVPANEVGPTQMLVARVLMRWTSQGSQAQRQFELFLARHR